MGLVRIIESKCTIYSVKISKLSLTKTPQGDIVTKLTTKNVNNNKAVK